MSFRDVPRKSPLDIYPYDDDVAVLLDNGDLVEAARIAQPPEALQVAVDSLAALAWALLCRLACQRPRQQTPPLPR